MIVKDKLFRLADRKEKLKKKLVEIYEKNTHWEGFAAKQIKMEISHGWIYNQVICRGFGR